MISVNESTFIFGTVWEASGTPKDIKLWFSIMINSHKNAKGKIIKFGDNQAKAIINTKKRE